MPEVGQWGPESFVDRRGRPTPGVTVTIYETDGVTPATLYAAQAGVVVLANPLPVGVASNAAGLDDRANGSFYAPPGPYVMAVVRGGVEVYRSPVTVGVDTTGAGVGAANGTVAVANLTWVMAHGLGIAVADFNPADWWFEDETGTPMEPIEVHHVTDDIASAAWLTPVRGTWRVS